MLTFIISIDELRPLNISIFIIHKPNIQTILTLFTAFPRGKLVCIKP